VGHRRKPTVGAANHGRRPPFRAARAGFGQNCPALRLVFHHTWWPAGPGSWPARPPSPPGCDFNELDRVFDRAYRLRSHKDDGRAPTALRDAPNGSRLPCLMAALCFSDALAFEVAHYPRMSIRMPPMPYRPCAALLLALGAVFGAPYISCICWRSPGFRGCRCPRLRGSRVLCGRRFSNGPGRQNAEMRRSCTWSQSEAFTTSYKLSTEPDLCDRFRHCEGAP